MVTGVYAVPSVVKEPVTSGVTMGGSVSRKNGNVCDASTLPA
jgi:hypothetical protein